MRTIIAAFLILTLAGCGGSNPPTGPGPVSTSLPQFRIAADPVIDMTRGETRALQVEERDASGTLITQPPTSYSWTSSDPDIVSVTAGGALEARADYGGAAITVRSTSGLTATTHVWVQLPEHVPSTYRITLVFSENVPVAWHDDFEWAAEIVQQVIRAPLPPVNLDSLAQTECAAHAGEPAIPRLTGIETGTIVYIGRSQSMGGPTTGGPCIQRPLPRPTSVFGRITIPCCPTTRPGVRLALHEIGHALGLVGVSSHVPSPGFDWATKRHTGPYALEGYRRGFGKVVPFLEVPSNSHWGFGGDVMSAFSPAIRITKVSAGALMDMGYPAAWYGAY